MLILIEWAGVAVSWIGKWLKAGSSDVSRSWGFWIQALLGFFWVGYFIWIRQFGLAVSAGVSSIIAIRGINNNTNKNLSET
jgi:hypothetical protein